MSPEELEFLTTNSSAAMAQFEKVSPQEGLCSLNHCHQYKLLFYIHTGASGDKVLAMAGSQVQSSSK